MWKQLLEQDTIFWFCAIAGSGMFVIQFALTLFGISNDSETSDSVEMEAAKIKWLSKQALTGFLMMFGWSALACKKEFAFSLPATACLSIVAGLATVAITGFIFKSAKRLHSSGTVFDLDKAIGKEATVYQRIAKDGVGKISVSIDGHAHEVDAIAADGEAIDSFLSVRIVKKIDSKTLAVSTKGNL